MWITDEDGSLINVEHLRSIVLQEPSNEPDVLDTYAVIGVTDDMEDTGVIIYRGTADACEAHLAKLRRKLCVRIE